MKLSFVISGLLCCLAAAQDAATTSQEASAAAAAAAAQLLLSMPKCGVCAIASCQETKLTRISQLACLETAVAASPCSPTDIACSCSNMTLQAQVQLCVAGSCTLRESLSTHPHNPALHRMGSDLLQARRTRRPPSVRRLTAINRLQSCTSPCSALRLPSLPSFCG